MAVTIGETWTHAIELATLREWARTAKVAVEIGTWTGRSAEAILAGMDDGDTGGTLICVDHFKGAPNAPQYGKYVESEDGRHEIKVQWRERLAKWLLPVEHQRCHLWEMPSANAAAYYGRWRADPIDFVFIDGDHAVEACQRDIDLWWPLIRPGGFLCGHDFNEVAVAVRERFEDHRIKVGPMKLWRVEKRGE